MSLESPQLEDGFTPVANPIMEALARTQLSGYEWRVLLFLLRKTYGWSKRSDVISLSQFVDGTGLDRRHVARTIKSLVRKRIVAVDSAKLGTSKMSTYTFNKHFGEWVASAILGTTSAIFGTKGSAKLGTHNIKSFTTEKGLLPPTPKTRTAKVTFDRMTGQFVGLTPELVLKLKSMYPGVDVDQVLREAPDWAMKKQRTDYWGSLKAFCKHELENLKRGGAHGTDQRRGYRPSIEDAIFTGEDCIGGRSS